MKNYFLDKNIELKPVSLSLNKEKIDKFIAKYGMPKHFLVNPRSFLKLKGLYEKHSDLDSLSQSSMPVVSRIYGASVIKDDFTDADKMVLVYEVDKKLLEAYRNENS